MRRRQVLATGALLLAGPLAGCADPAGVLELVAVDDAELAERASRSGAGLPEERGRVVREAVENGSGTIEDTYPPVEDGLPVALDGRYYDLDWTVVEERTVTLYDVEIDYDPADTDGSSVGFDELPAVDRDALGGLVPPRTDRRVEGTDLGAGVRYSPAEAEASVLVPEQQYEFVVHDGTRYRLETDDGRDVTVQTFEYTAREVASSAEAYAAHLRARYLFELSGLSDAEREVVEEAIDGGYYAGDDGDDAFRSVTERTRSHDAVRADEYDGEWLLRYDGTVYWADLYLGQFADG